MNISSLLRLGLLFALPALAFPAARAQSPSSSASASAASAAPSTITLAVQVADKSGAPILGLSQSAFTLLDNKKPQSLASFAAINSKSPSPSDPPIEIILVVDSVNVGPQIVAYERNQIKSFLLRNGGELQFPVSLIVFNDTATRLQNTSSRDGKALAAFYDQYETGTRVITPSQGIYGAEDRLDLSLKTLNSIAWYARSVPGRKLVIWISPGWPLITGPFIEISDQQQKIVFQSIVTMSDTLRESNVTLYAVDPLGLTDAGGSWLQYYKDFLKGVPSPSKVQIADLALQVISVQSGGAVYNASNNLADSLAKCVSDGAAYYLLTYAPPPAAQPNEYHSLEVKVEAPGATVRTRTGYYTQP